MKGIIFVYVATYGGAAVALLNPYVGLLIYIGFAILKPERLWAVPVGNYSRIVAMALVVGWVANGLGRWRFGPARGPVAALMFFWGWVILSATQAPDQAVAWGFIEQKSKIFLPFLVGITTIGSMRQLKQLLWVIVISIGYVALRENEAYYDGVFYERDNLICHMVVTGLAPAFFLGLQVADWKGKALAFAGGALMLHTVLIHQSRGAILGAILTGGVCFLLLPKRLGHYLLFLVVLLVALRLAGSEVRERFTTTFAAEENRDYSAQSRVDLWRDMADATQKHPIFGIGPDHWPLIVHQYGWPPGKEGHGLWSQTAAETGLPGIASLVLFYTLIMVRLLPYAWQRAAAIDPWVPTFARAVIACLAGFMLEAQFGSFEGLEAPYYVALLGAGTLKVVSGLATAGASGAAAHPPAS